MSKYSQGSLPSAAFRTAWLSRGSAIAARGILKVAWTVQLLILAGIRLAGIRLVLIQIEALQ
jgi:hypothetical protein